MTNTGTVQLEMSDDGRVILDHARLEALLTEAYRKGFADGQSGAQASDETVRIVEATE